MLDLSWGVSDSEIESGFLGQTAFDDDVFREPIHSSLHPPLNILLDDMDVEFDLSSVDDLGKLWDVSGSISGDSAVSLTDSPQHVSPIIANPVVICTHSQQLLHVHCARTDPSKLLHSIVHNSELLMSHFTHTFLIMYSQYMYLLHTYYCIYQSHCS